MQVSYIWLYEAKGALKVVVQCKICDPNMENMVKPDVIICKLDVEKRVVKKKTYFHFFFFSFLTSFVQWLYILTVFNLI